MLRHRTRFLILALGAWIALSAGEARAGTLIITIKFDSVTIIITATSAFAQAGSTNNNLQVNTTALNSTLKTDGSAFSFSNLGALSNMPGAANPTGATLSESGAASISQAGNTSISIVTTQSGFSVPSGTGTLNALETSSFSGSTAGDSQTTSSSYNALDTVPHTYTSTGPALNGDKVGSSMGIGLVPTSGYSLNASAGITLTTGSDSFSSSSQVLAGAVPEPTSIIMLLTGLPLPLALVGLMRRRRAVAR